MHGWQGYGHMGWLGIWWVLGAALIVGIVWVLLRSARGPLRRRSAAPELILKRRYAKGEIDRETYQRMLAEIEG